MTISCQNMLQQLSDQNRLDNDEREESGEAKQSPGSSHSSSLANASSQKIYFIPLKSKRKQRYQ